MAGRVVPMLQHCLGDRHKGAAMFAEDQYGRPEVADNRLAGARVCRSQICLKIVTGCVVDLKPRLVGTYW